MTKGVDLLHASLLLSIRAHLKRGRRWDPDCLCLLGRRVVVSGRERTPKRTRAGEGEGWSVSPFRQHSNRPPKTLTPACRWTTRNSVENHPASASELLTSGLGSEAEGEKESGKVLETARDSALTLPTFERRPTHAYQQQEKGSA